MADITLTSTSFAPVNLDFCGRTYLAAADLSAGEAVYINTSGAAAKAKADAIGTSKVKGVVGRTVKSGQPVTVYEEVDAYGYDLSGLAYGAAVYLSDATAGAFADAAASGTGHVVVPVGRVDVITEAGGTLTKILKFEVPANSTYTAL